MAVTAAGGGVGQSVLRALAWSELPLRVVAVDASRLSAGLYWVPASYLVPSAADEQAYVASLLEVCALEGVDCLIPGTEPELAAISRARDRFLDAGCVPVVAAPELVELVQDKLALFDFSIARGLPFVRTASLSAFRDDPDKLGWPVIVKPRSGGGSVGARLAWSLADMTGLQSAGPMVVQQYLPPVPSSRQPSPIDLAPVTPFRHTKLNQSNELSIQYYVATSGEILGEFGSTNRLKDGVPIEIVPCLDPEVLGAARSIAEALSGLGLTGPINLQGRHTSDGPRFFEANARFTGITGVRAAMGYREVDAALWDSAGQIDRARACLTWKSSYIGLRYPDESVIDSGRLAQVSLPGKGYEPRPQQRALTVFVTGATGYLGSNFVDCLLASDAIAEVRVLVRAPVGRLEYATKQAGRVRVVEVAGSLPPPSAALEGVDVVAHLAAARPMGRTGHTSAARLFETNVEGTRLLLSAMNEAGVPALVLLSSVAVYGRRRPSPWSELLPPAPDTAYGTSKLVAETLSLNHATSVKSVVVLRCSALYGLGRQMRWNEFSHRFCQLSSRGLPLPIENGGAQKVDLVHVRDACAAILLACTHAAQDTPPIVVNIGGGRPTAVVDIASMCRKIGVELGLPEVGSEFRPAGGPIFDFGMDIRRARSRLGWHPQLSLEEGLRELIAAALDLAESAREET